MSWVVHARSGWTFLRRQPVVITTLGLLLCALSVYWTGNALNAAVPFDHWLVFRYLLLWGWLALFSLACTSFGYLVLVRGLRLTNLGTDQSVVFGMALGTITFVLAMYGAGAAGAFAPWFAVALPLAMLAASGSYGARLALELYRSRGAGRKTSLVANAALLFGVFCVFFTYLRTLTPDGLGYDAAWYHVKIAQDYARWGGIGPFPGDYSHALPQLASLLYTWGYLLPGLHLAERWIFALQMEFCLLLWTLASVAVAVRVQLGASAPPGSWATYYLLPGTLLFTVIATSDHVVGFFAVPIALATVSLFDDADPDPRKGALLGAVMGGGLLAKYQIVYLLIPACLVAMIPCLVTCWRLRRAPERRQRLLRLLQVPLAACLAGAVVTLPQFLKNCVYYGNPVYPFLMEWFPSRPSVPLGSLLLKYGLEPSAYVHQGGALETATFSAQLLGTVPLAPRFVDPQGSYSLFVMLAPAALWFRGRALRLFVVLGLGTLLVWGVILANMRFMSAFLPVLAAALAALLVRLWSSGTIVRVGVSLAVSLQVLWVVDAPFNEYNLPTLNATIDLFREAIKNPTGPKLFDRYRQDFLAARDALPGDAKVVIHTSGVTLGIDRDIYMDAIGFQGLIDYRPMRTPRDVYLRFRELGVTHTIHQPRGYASHTLQEDVLFHALVQRYAKDYRIVGPFYIATLPSRHPPAEKPLQVVSAGMHLYPDGLYAVDQLGVWERLPKRYRNRPLPRTHLTEDNRTELLEAAQAVVCGGSCDLQHELERAGMKRVPDHPGDFALFLRAKE